MRIAVLSDIHGNLVALDAVTEDLERAAPDEIWCGGDIAWAGPWPGECIARVRAAGWPTVKGNTDVWVTGDPQSLSSAEERAELESIASAHGISDDDARWLISLPMGHSGPGSILLVHATPESAFDAPMPDAPSSDFAVYEDAATLVVYAHVHRAFVRRLLSGTLVCNTGSVGLPMDGDTASYLLIDQDGPDLTLRHRRVDFDRAAVVDEAKRIGGPLGAQVLEAIARK